MWNPSQILQAFFLLAASTIVFLNCIPTIRENFITYGPRATAPVQPSHAAAAKIPRSHKTILDKLIETIASLQVPHAFFNHFYFVSISSSLFWSIQHLTNRPLLSRICDAVPQTSNASMSMEQIELTWAMMSIQGLRRQLETILLAKPSTSKMWFVHYLLGITFYLAMSIAVWIEGARTLSTTTRSALTYSSTPSIHTMLSLPIFLLASGIQHDCHSYLASLPKYTLPTHPIFTLLICPHYTAECMIYLSLALMAAPDGMWVNRTVMAAFVFVATNLAVTAQGTRVWYEGKFGKEAVRGRWNMVPFVW